MSSRTRGLSGADRKKLWGLSHGQCAFPQCRQRLVENVTDVASGHDSKLVIGEEAHIYPYSVDGPRYDPKYPPELLETYQNRVLLCPTHHVMVDAKGASGFDAATLLRMKKEHEEGLQKDEELKAALNAYLGGQMDVENRVQFRQARLDGPTVESMFVDVPFGCRESSPAADLLEQIAQAHPGDLIADEGTVATGAAQALLHPAWRGNAFIIGGPGQGKSTLLQYICQFHRARYLGRQEYSGEVQGLRPVTSVARIPIKVELRRYAEWALAQLAASPAGIRSWPAMELFLIHEIDRGCGEHRFAAEHFSRLVANLPLLIALDGLDEVANLDHRETAADEILGMASRLTPNAHDLVMVVTSRPGHMNSRLVSSTTFPRFNLLKLSAGLRLQYLNRWMAVSELSSDQADGLRRTYQSHEELPHIRDLASYPMQFAILLHLLRDRGLFPKQRTELYAEYLKAFLDREETEDKDPLVSTQRTVLLRVHSFLGWHLQTVAEATGDAGQLPREDLRQQLRLFFADQPEGLHFADRLFNSMQSRVLCLVERENGFQFEVQSLREYFAALYVHENADPRGKHNSRVHCFEAMVCRPYWLNVCRFFVGMFTWIEIRGIYSTLIDLVARGNLGLAPHLRMVASRLLDDRSYQGQSDRELRQVVGFILAGPGARLAEDGFLDDIGSPLTFSDDAGRRQAVDWLKDELPGALEDGGRARAVAACLRRNSTLADNVRVWWWNEYRPSLPWLTVAAELDITAYGDDQEARLLAAAESVEGSPNAWATELLLRGGYDGESAEVLKLAQRELNAGFHAPVTQPTTPLEALCAASWLVQSKSDPTLAAQLDAYLASRNSQCGAWRRLVVDSLELGDSPSPSDGTSWRNRLGRIAEIWGQGWILHRSAASVPLSVDLTHEGMVMGAARQPGSAAVQFEANLRLHRGDASGWLDSLPAEATHRLFWLLSVFAHASTSAFIEVLPAVDAVVCDLSPKHYRALQSCLIRVAASKLDLRDPLRLQKVQVTARCLWLLRGVAGTGTHDQIDRRLRADVTSVLAAGVADPIALFDALGTRLTTPVTAFHHCRLDVRAGALDHLKIGAVSTAQATMIIDRPEDWPVEIVGRALGRASSSLAKLEPIQAVARRDKWFTADLD